MPTNHPSPGIFWPHIFFWLFFFLLCLSLFPYLPPKQNLSSQIQLFSLVSYTSTLLALFFTFARVMIFLWFAGICCQGGFCSGQNNFRRIFARGLNRVKLTKILVISTAIVVLFGIFIGPKQSVGLKFLPERKPFS